jgi:hypothetical protein
LGIGSARNLVRPVTRISPNGLDERVALAVIRCSPSVLLFWVGLSWVCGRACRTICLKAWSKKENLHWSERKDNELRSLLDSTLRRRGQRAG